jgi:hypothetical protein
MKASEIYWNTSALEKNNPSNILHEGLSCVAGTGLL